MSIEPACGGQTTLKDKRVLVVEDEAIIAMLFEEELLEAGAEVVVAEVGVDAAHHKVAADPRRAGHLDPLADVQVGGPCRVAL